MADVDKQEEAAGEATEVTLAETETAARPTTDTRTVTETGALATDDWSDPAKLRRVIRRGRCGAGAGSRTPGGCGVRAIATERQRSYCDQPFGI